MNTLDKYRVTVCFFLEPNSKGVRILVPCQDTWTINRLKDEALRRLHKNLTSQSSDSDREEKAPNIDDIHVKHIENLSKDRLDGDDIIRDVLDNKEILVARLEGDQDVDFFNNDHLLRGAGSGSIAGESVRSTLLPGSQVYPESVQFPLRSEPEFGTPERHSVYYPHSYYGHGRHSFAYSVQDDLLDMQLPPRPFGHAYYQGASSDYELPRLHPRFTEGIRNPFPRPDSSNSDVQHGSDPSQFMGHLNSCSPSALSEEQSSFSHVHTFSNPEQMYPLPSSETSPSGGVFTGGIPSDDSGFSNHNGLPQPLYRQNSYPIPVSSPLAQTAPQRNKTGQPVPGDSNLPLIKSPVLMDPEVTAESPDSPVSPSPNAFQRKKQGTSVMLGYVNPVAPSIPAFSAISEVSAQSESYSPQLNSTSSPTLSDRRQSPSPRITLRLIPKLSSTVEPSTISEQDESAPSPPEMAPPPLDCDPEPTQVPTEPPPQSFSDVSIDSPISPSKEKPLEKQIEQVIETAVELPEQVHMETSCGEILPERDGQVEPSPSLPQKRVKTSDSPPPSPPHNQLPTTPLTKSIHSVFPILNSESDNPELPSSRSAPAPPAEQPQGQEPVKAPSMVGVTREIGAIFMVELVKGASGLGFGIKSRDTAADGMTYPHFVSSIKTNGVAQTDGRLRVGDLLLEVNGTDVTLLTHVKCLDFMRRQRGSVQLKISRQAKLKSAGDPDGSSYAEVGIEEQTMDLVTPPVVENPPILENGPSSEEVKRVETIHFEKSIESLSASNTSLDKITPMTPQILPPEEVPEIRVPQSEGRLNTPVSSSQAFLKQVALTDKIVYTPRGKIVEPLDILLTDAGTKGLGVSVRGKTRIATNGKSQEGGIFVKEIVQGGAAYKDGRLKPNDQILSINGCVLIGQSNVDAMETLKQGQNLVAPGAPVIKLVIAKKSSVSSRHGKRANRNNPEHYARKLSIGSKNTAGIHYANTHLSNSIPSIYHPIRMEGLPKTEEVRVFSVLDAQPNLNSSQDKNSGSPPPDYESLVPEHIYDVLDSDKKQRQQKARKGVSPPLGDITRFRTTIHQSLDVPEEEHIYARPQRRQTEENIYVRPNKVLYGRLGSGARSISAENSLNRTPTYTEEIYAHPKMSKEELSKRKPDSIYEAPVMVKPKYGDGVFVRKPREHLYESVTEVLESRESEEDFQSVRSRPAVVSLYNNDPTNSIERNLTPTDYRHPGLTSGGKSLTLQKTPSGEHQSIYATGRSTPRGPRTVSNSRAVPHAPFSAIKRPASRSGRVQYPPPVDLSPYFTSVQQQLATTRQMSGGDIPEGVATSPPELYPATIVETSNGPTPLSTPRRPPPSVPSSTSPVDPASPNDVTFASEQDESLGPVEFRRDGQGRDEFSERHPFAKDAKQLITYKDRQYKLAETKLKAMQPQQLSESSTPFQDPEAEIREHPPLTGSHSTPENDKARERANASKRGSFFGGLFKRKKKETSNRNPRDTPSPILESMPPLPTDELSVITNMVPTDDD